VSEIQGACLLFMFLVGFGSLPLLPDQWDIQNGYRTKRQRIFWIAWLIFWWMPPLATIWIRGVMG